VTEETQGAWGDEGSWFDLDCDTCAMKDTDACKDCVVTYILQRPEGAVVYDAAEERALRTMASAGLLPLPRWEPREAAGDG
jgi:hypothetical protein